LIINGYRPDCETDSSRRTTHSATVGTNPLGRFFSQNRTGDPGEIIMKSLRDND
jgi:hypothetical protein